MLPKLLTSIFGSRNERLLKTYRRTVAQINALEPKFETLSDDEWLSHFGRFQPLPGQPGPRCPTTIVRGSFYGLSHLHRHHCR